MVVPRCLNFRCHGGNLRTAMGDNSASTRVLVTIFSVYLCTVPFAAGYYNWQYARENGFMTWLLLGEIVPSAKSLVWPYFALQSRAQAQQQSRPQLGSSDPRVIGLTKQQVAEAEINRTAAELFSRKFGRNTYFAGF